MLEDNETFIRDLPVIKEVYTKELHSWNDRYYVVSRVIAEDHGGWETMIFNSSKDGEITNWGEIYEHRGYETIGESIASCLDSHRVD